jgi:hypothetical protein
LQGGNQIPVYKTITGKGSAGMAKSGLAVVIRSNTVDRVNIKLPTTVIQGSGREEGSQRM